MNLSQNTTYLRSIDGVLTDNIHVKLNSIGNDVAGIGVSQANNINTINSISSNVSGINTSVNNIEDELLKKKIIFNARLTDGTNNYLAKANYTSGGVGVKNFYWSNDKGATAYIYQYRFIYPNDTEPDSDELYHSTGWESKIGAMNSAGTDYETPFITVNDNKDYMFGLNGGGEKQTWTSDSVYVYRCDFDEAPIEIGVSRRFGHYIDADMSTTDYDANPIGIVSGYYYSSS